MLKAHELQYTYPETSPQKGLFSISFELEKGKVLAVTGPSGSGKSTLLKAVYGLVDLEKGSVELEGEKVKGPAYKLLPGHDRMRLVYQDFKLLWKHKVYDNIEQQLRHLLDDEKHEAVLYFLQLCGLTEHQAKLPEQLSGGQQQRLSIARALAGDPEVLLLDEPFSQLDNVLQAQLMQHVLEHVRQNQLAVLYTTHDPNEALQHGDEVLYMEGGKEVQKGVGKELFFKPKTISIGHYFGILNVVEKEVFEQLFGETNLQHCIDDNVLFRPNQVLLAEDGIAMQIEHIAFAGTDQLVVLSNGKQKIKAAFSSAMPLSEKDEVRVKLLPNPLFTVQ
tara:strand:+ start:4663 stop:5664 length:1002 start_codon:yes stop_codon:yes gene_type:complete